MQQERRNNASFTEINDRAYVRPFGASTYDTISLILFFVLSLLSIAHLMFPSISSPFSSSATISH